MVIIISLIISFTILSYVFNRYSKMLTPNTMTPANNKQMLKKKSLIWKHHKKSQSPRLDAMRKD